MSKKVIADPTPEEWAAALGDGFAELVRWSTHRTSSAPCARRHAIGVRSSTRSCRATTLNQVEVATEEVFNIQLERTMPRRRAFAGIAPGLRIETLPLSISVTCTIGFA